MTESEREKIYLNVRKAYRLLYSVQDSIHDMALYLKNRLACTDEVGKQIFSDDIHLSSKTKAEYSRELFYENQWSWDYFPSYLYNYYYDIKPKDNRFCGFSLTAVMDDGSMNIRDIEPDPLNSDFISVEKSESYFLFSFCSWLAEHSSIYYDSMSNWEAGKQKYAMFDIAKEISNNPNSFIEKGDLHSLFIAWKIPMKRIGTKQDIDNILNECDKLIFKKTSMHILSDLN